jgi:hypothetical protein
VCVQWSAPCRHATVHVHCPPLPCALRAGPLADPRTVAGGASDEEGHGDGLPFQSRARVKADKSEYLQVQSSGTRYGVSIPSKHCVLRFFYRR